MEQEDEIDLLIDMCCCIVDHLKSTEEHYEIARKLTFNKIQEIFKIEEKKLKFTELLIKKCKNNSEIFESICKFTKHESGIEFSDERFEIPFELESKKSLGIENVESMLRLMLPIFNDILHQGKVMKSTNHLLKPWKSVYLVLTKDFKLNLYPSLESYERNKDLKENSIMNSASVTKMKGNVFVVFDMKKKWTIKTKNESETSIWIQWIKLSSFLNKN
jgi:hypothetical protein